VLQHLQRPQPCDLPLVQFEPLRLGKAVEATFHLKNSRHDAPRSMNQSVLLRSRWFKAHRVRLAIPAFVNQTSSTTCVASKYLTHIYYLMGLQSVRLSFFLIVMKGANEQKDVCFQLKMQKR